MRSLGGAHYGIGQWLGQRITAVIMAVYTLFAILAFAIVRPTDQAAWKVMFAQDWMRIATLIFFLSLCFHTWVGMRDILMDYCKPAGLRLILMTCVGVSLVWYAIWLIQILWSD